MKSSMTLSRYLLSVICVCILAPFSLFAQSTTKDYTKIAIFSDLHYLASNLRDVDSKTQEISEITGKNIIASTEVLEAVIAKLDSADIDVLLIAGDLSFEGEKDSHKELTHRLMLLKDKGVAIFVIPGNHDINNQAAKGFSGNASYATASVSPQEFVEVYGRFGYENALSRDDNSLSYINEIDRGTWLLAIDVADYTDNGNRSVGKISQGQEDWILEVLQNAKYKKKKVIAMMHWGLLEHMPLQAKLMPTYLVSDVEKIKNLLADNGVEVVFTGHFHANDINKSTTDRGNSIYDVATGALVSYPYVVRYANLYADSISIKSDFLYQTPSYPNLWEDSKEVLMKMAQKRSIPFIEKFGFDFSAESLQKLSYFAAKYFVASLMGDESFDQKDIVQIQDIFLNEGFPVNDTWHDLDLDNAIPDNQIIIPFSKHSF